MAAVEAIGVRHPTDVTPELLNLIGTDCELRAVRALGEVANADIAEQFSTHIAEVDKRMGVLFPAPKATGKAGSGSKSPSQIRAPEIRKGPPAPQRPPEHTPSSQLSGTPGGVLYLPFEFWTMTPEKYGKRAEAERLAYLRGELVLAEEKIRIRGRWEAAKDAAGRQAVYEDAKKSSSLAVWAESRLRVKEEETAPFDLDATRLSDAPTSGETLLPANTSLYLMAPTLEETIAKINAALAGIQMESVRDQTLFVVILKSLKAKLAAKLSAEAETDASAALGLDLRKPLAVASWPGARAGLPASSALIARVLDPDRFERAVALYLKEVGSFDSFATAASSVVRMAGVIPAIVPASVALVANPELAHASAAKEPVVSAHVFVRREMAGRQLILVIEKIATYASGVTRREAVFLTYLGSTAVLAPTRAALIDVLAASPGRPAFAQSREYASVRSERGEVVFFSRAGELFKDFLKDSKEEMFVTLAEKLGVETGSLQITPKAWQTDFHLRVADDSITKNMRDVTPSDLSAPRELLPASTVVYAGGVVDAMGAWQALKAALSEQKHDASAPADVIVSDEEIEKSIIPHLQGEMGFALLSMLQAIQGDTTNVPLVFFFKLKNGDLAKLLREQKVFSAGSSSPDVKVFGEPVTRVGRPFGPAEFYAVATDQWLIIAQNEEALHALEATSKLGSTRDYTRTLAAVTDKHVSFLTYNLDAALAEAQEKFSIDETGQNFRAAMTAVTHAFHSQRAFVSVGAGEWDGQMTVAFGREGRYSVGELSTRSAEVDVANANITPSGVRILQPTKVEELRVRLRAKQSGLISRLQEDFLAVSWQHIENASDTEMVFDTRARRIDGARTILLPVKSPEMEPYLRANQRIRSAAPEIVALATQIGGDDRDGRRVARKLGEWTFKNLKWKRVESDAVETLAKREADCLEHSELYVSLARALGLPARVVYGMAYSDGSFGGHAWVEIYLGDWVEVDPTWGSMDYVDASHLRFKLDAVSSLALLGLIEMEVLDARGLITDDQRDPMRLIHALANTTDKQTAAFAYDFQLIATASLGDGALNRLDDKQRAAVIRAFDRAVSDDLSDWQSRWGERPSVLTSSVDGNRAGVEVLRDNDLYRVSLAKRDGAWFVTEIEDMDSGLLHFRTALEGAIHRGSQPERSLSGDPSQALKQTERSIAANGETPVLLLRKARLLRQLKFVSEEKQGKTYPAEVRTKPEDVLGQIIAKWPDFAPAYFALARGIVSDKSSADRAAALFEQYAKLVPFDPRPWTELGEIHEKHGRFGDAEKAYRRSVALEPGNYNGYVKLAIFLAARGNAAEARKSLSAAFEHGDSMDDVLGSIDAELIITERSKEETAQLDEVLLTLSAALEKSVEGLRWIARCKHETGRQASAIETMKRVLAREQTAGDYSLLAFYYRGAHQYQQALDASDAAVKLEASSARAHFERARALAQLGRTQDALAALKRAIELDEEDELDLEDADLKPLASDPEFKALIEKRGKEDVSDQQQGPARASASRFLLPPACRDWQVIHRPLTGQAGCCL